MNTDCSQNLEVEVKIGTNRLSRDLVWCECGRGLSLTGRWIYCPSCGKKINQQSYAEAVKQAEAHGAFVHRFVDEEERAKALDNPSRIRAAIVATFGGMGSGSVVWGNTQWDKGFTAGVQAALTAFDAASKE